MYEMAGLIWVANDRFLTNPGWELPATFYYFGHYYGAICIQQLPVVEREPYQGLVAKLMLDRQEQNGSWWDYPLYDYHQQYGTAYALMTLQRCLPTQE